MNTSKPVVATSDGHTRVTTVYLVRHGETAMNATSRCQGTIDEPLSAEGEAQVLALSMRLGPIAFDAVYASTLKRANTTARLLSPQSAHAVRSEIALIELDYGDCQGLMHDEWPDGLVKFWHAKPWDMSFQNGETLHKMRARVVPVFSRIVDEHVGETVLVVAHGHVNRVLLLHALGLPDDRFWTFEQRNVETWKLEFLTTETGAKVLRSAEQVASSTTANRVDAG